MSALATYRPEECLQLLEQTMPWEDEEDLLGGIEHLLLEEDNQPVRGHSCRRSGLSEDGEPRLLTLTGR